MILKADQKEFEEDLRVLFKLLVAIECDECEAEINRLHTRVLGIIDP